MPLRIKHRTTAALSVTVLVTLGILLTSCGNAGDPAKAEPVSTDSPTVRTVQVETTVLQPSRFEDMIALIGVVEAPRDAILSAQSTGTLVLQTTLGTSFRKGAVIARIDGLLIEAALDQAKASLESASARAQLAQDTYRRQEPLYADSIISALEYEQLRSELNAANAQLSQAKALVSQAEKQLENTYVRAPFNGRIESVFAEQGEQLMMGTQVVRIVGTDNLKITAGVPERYAIDVREGSEVSVYFKAYGVGERSGVISFVGSVIDPQSRSFAIEIELSNEGGVLKPEMVADVLVTRTVLDDQIVLPQSAILLDENGSSVYLVDGSNGRALASRRSVELGPSFGGQTVITSGLMAGEEVIVVGQANVTDGDAVRAIQTNG